MCSVGRLPYFEGAEPECRELHHKLQLVRQHLPVGTVSVDVLCLTKWRCGHHCRGWNELAVHSAVDLVALLTWYRDADELRSIQGQRIVDDSTE